jgi:hypothetical protein
MMKRAMVEVVIIVVLASCSQSKKDVPTGAPPTTAGVLSANVELPANAPQICKDLAASKEIRMLPRTLPGLFGTDNSAARVEIAQAASELEGISSSDGSVKRAATDAAAALRVLVANPPSDATVSAAETSILALSTALAAVCVFKS